jgi:hypothetical protein
MRLVEHIEWRVWRLGLVLQRWAIRRDRARRSRQFARHDPIDLFKRGELTPTPREQAKRMVEVGVK